MQHRFYLFEASDLHRWEPERPRCVCVCFNVVEIENPVAAEGNSFVNGVKDGFVGFCESELEREESDA